MPSPLPPARVRLTLGAAGLCSALVMGSPSLSSAQVEGSVEAVERLYAEEGPDAPRDETALLARAEGRWSWDDGRQTLTISPFLRLARRADGRSRVDLQEASWTWQGRRWEVDLGIRVLRWGVVESVALVDVVNQRDHASDALRPIPLGQPLAGARLFTGVGSFEAYGLAGFREREFDGREARTWSGLPVDRSAPRFEAGRGERPWGGAIRWSHFFGPFDVAVSHFRGTARSPEPHLVQDASGDREIVPVYATIDQTSLEGQWTHRSWLLKLEALARTGRGATRGAVVAGVEYAFADFLSVFGEYVHDRRPVMASRSLDHDVFLGGRLLTQDWTLQARSFLDVRSGNLIASVAATRRLSDRVTATLDARSFQGDSQEEPYYANRVDSHLSVRLAAFF